MTKILPTINISRTKDLAHDVYRYAYNSDSRITQKLADFYQEGIKCPSVAKMIAKKAVIDGTKYYGDMLQEDIGSLRGKPWDLIKNYIGKTILALVNIDSGKNQQEVKKYYDVFEKEFKELYPKTHKVREQIIGDRRVLYGETKSIQPKSLKTRFKYTKLFSQSKE